MTDKNIITSSNGQTLAARAAGLLTKQTAYSVAEKALQQAIDAKRVYPAMASDFAGQLGIDLPLKTRDFVKVVTNILASSEKPVKGIVSKRKNQILIVLSDLVAALTDTTPIGLPLWALPKERAKTAEAEAEAAEDKAANGALARANAQAEALASAVMAEAKSDNALAKAVATIVANAAALTQEQREAIALALAATEPAML